VNTRPRIFGIEMELAVGIWNDQKKVFWREKGDSDHEEQAGYRFVRFGAGELGWFENGARFYKDTGGHPEYATPECSSVREVTLYDKALEKHMAYLSDLYTREADELPRQCRLIVLKNTHDIRREATWGCHENYCIPRVAFHSILAPTSASSVVWCKYLDTRAIISGNGGMLSNYTFALSPRALHFSKELSCCATSDAERSVINTRDESLMSEGRIGGELYNRLHVIFGNANMSEWSTFLKVGTAHLILKTIERLSDKKETEKEYRRHIPYLDAFTECSNLWLLKQIGSHFDCVKVYNVGGANLSACNIQRMLLGMVENVLGSEMSEEERVIAHWWDTILTHIEQNDHDFLSQYLDWAMKLRLLQTWLDKKGISPDILSGRSFMSRLIGRKPEWLSGLFMLDQCFHDVSEQGYYNMLVAKGLAKTLLQPQAVQWARVMPPQNTRARWRGMSIKYARRQHRKDVDLKIEYNFKNSWGPIVCKVRSEKNPTWTEECHFTNPDPWNTDWSAVKKFIDEH